MEGCVWLMLLLFLLLCSFLFFLDFGDSILLLFLPFFVSLASDFLHRNVNKIEDCVCFCAGSNNLLLLCYCFVYQWTLLFAFFFALCYTFVPKINDQKLMMWGVFWTKVLQHFDLPGSIIAPLFYWISERRFEIAFYKNNFVLHVLWHLCPRGSPCIYLLLSYLPSVPFGLDFRPVFELVKCSSIRRINSLLQ